MSETGQEALPQSLKDLRAQIAQDEPTKWGSVNTDEGAFRQWLQEGIAKWDTNEKRGTGLVKHLFGRMSRPFQRQDIQK